MHLSLNDSTKVVAVSVTQRFYLTESLPMARCYSFEHFEFNTLAKQKIQFLLLVIFFPRGLYLRRYVRLSRMRNRLTCYLVAC